MNIFIKKKKKDELPAFRDQIGKVVEIETSDDTLQIQWENYDTCWVPAFACGPAPSGSKATIPGTNNSWLNESKEVGHEYKEEPEEQAVLEEEEVPLLASVEDPAAAKGNSLRVTRHLKVLEEKWAQAELGSHDDLSVFLGAVGTVEETSEDDDSVKLKWANGVTTWVPIAACSVPILFFF
ncbi:hypothetical protein RFI_17952 [Reticulomyxa filosa]|uniref:Uncharacterized protein n=1 Tax=Reticulomyxa filosa TaxID=46433 RepID=X6N053_RETFI|nr:hypothetical protein RFI_17952 [Reticulomyxa filosa]|eukprot:ETO19278.1 hypothetical protein RFI_17952 [Reticulomyxa filosa]